MGIAYLIVGLVGLWMLSSLIKGQKTQCRNQVKIAKLLQDLNK